MIDGLQLFTSFMNVEFKTDRPDVRLAATGPCWLQLRTLVESSGSRQSGYCYTGDVLWKRDTCLQEIKLLYSLSMSKWGCYNRQPSKSSPKVLHSHFVFDTRVKIFVTSPEPIIFFNKRFTFWMSCIQKTYLSAALCAGVNTLWKPGTLFNGLWMVQPVH
jgi:hypothetical protein